jgi:hypothetical protein
MKQVGTSGTASQSYSDRLPGPSSTTPGPVKTPASAGPTNIVKEALQLLDTADTSDNGSATGCCFGKFTSHVIYII